MSTFLRRFALLLFLCAAHRGCGAVTAADFAGRWSWTVPGVSNAPDRKETLDIAVTGSSPAFGLTGTFTTGGKTLALASVVVAQGQLSFNLPASDAPAGAASSYLLSLDGALRVTVTVPAATSTPEKSTVLSYFAIRDDSPQIIRQTQFTNLAFLFGVVGDPVNMMVAATSPSPISYQWTKNGIDLPGATNANYRISAIIENDAADYRCLIRNATSSVLSRSLRLMVMGPRSLDYKTVGYVTTDGTFNATEDIVGAPRAAVIGTVTEPVPPSQLAPNQPIIIGDGKRSSFSTSGTSNTLIVQDGASIQMTGGAKGEKPMSIQWFRDGVAISDATNAQLQLSALTPLDSGTYKCTVSNSVGTGDWATVLTVKKAPVIFEATSSVRAITGQGFTLTTRATSDSAASYQWFHNNTAVVGATNATYEISNASAADAGTWRCEVTNAGGFAAATLSVGIAPSILVQPSGARITEGASLQLSVVASNATTYQWIRNGSPIAGATSPTYLLSAASVGDAGSYTCALSNSTGAVYTTAVSVVVERLARLVNLSTRVPVGGPAGLPICGFVISGEGHMNVLVRSVGPTLGTFGVSGPLPDPMLSLNPPVGPRLTNDNWDVGYGAVMQSAGAYALPVGSRDAAVVALLGAGNHTADTADTANREGVVLLEVYDAAWETSQPRFNNASTRGFVGTGDRIMVAGFYIAGTGSQKVLVRAAGPALAAFGISNVLADPKIEVYRASTLIATNDNWDSGNATSLKATMSAVGAFEFAPGTKDAAVLLTLEAGPYSAQVSGADGTTGTALLELYAVP